MKACYQTQTRPLANPENILCDKYYRITLLTERLVRLEYAEDGIFEDGATQTVWNRDFAPVPHTISRTSDGIVLRTSHLQIVYNEQPFSAHGLTISLHGSGFYTNDWHYGDELRDLKGTARTLDEVDGDQVTLGHGLISPAGYSVLDDSGSLVLTDDGWVRPRKPGCKDLYFFGYGHEYLDALRDFYYLCGPTPMLPRFVLGNWWSRFYKYTQQGYLALMDHFEQEGIPLSVAVIDMDWHLVDIDPKYGHGWTGFTWNPTLFPDHQAFLDALHQRGMRVTLNLHPASGIRAYEKAYPALAQHMGVDTASEEPVSFDPSDPMFMQYYYEDVLHPMEDEGVDFWWIDWQQGTHTKIAGLDPLWMLNHYDFLDSGRRRKRPLIFSRYAGPGSHRYPIGFSGDTIVTWESLRFQPYFTATASNIGYGWWSHDIGGHMNGYKNDELMARWTQLGAFSPILRLHSSCSEFNGKEPWRYKPEAADAMTQALRLRHRMIPYLYTMNYRCYAQGIPLVLPLYYLYPDEPWAYNHPNEYYFGSELLVQPITSPRLAGLNVAKENMYLPDGLWYDIFAHRAYHGGRELTIYRSLDRIPVFAKAGAILPMTDQIDSFHAAANPEQLHLHVFLGAQGEFVLYEDDGETVDYEDNICVRTRMVLENGVFRICAAIGHTELLPSSRRYLVELIGCSASPKNVTVTADGIPVQAKIECIPQGPTMTISVEAVPVTSELMIQFGPDTAHPHNESQQEIFDFLNQAEIAFSCKDRVFHAVQTQETISLLLSELNAMQLDPDLFGALTELLTAY